MTPGPKDLSQLARQGIDLCRRGEWEKGAVCLKEVVQGDDPGHLPECFYSYLGCCLAGLEGRHREGVELCQKAIDIAFYDPENYLNLARIHFASERHGPGFEALNKGLEIDPENGRLIELRDRVSSRQDQMVPFLERGHPLNRMLGKIRHNVSSDDTD